MDLNETPAGDDFLRHPWELARAQFFADVLRPVLSDRALSLLDAGAGDGWFAGRIAAEHPALNVTCFDPAYESEAGATFRDDHVTLTSTQPPGLFDVVTLLDVLEHVEDDASLLSELVASIAPGGYLLTSVPTWPSLFSSHDVMLKHFRRYVPRELTALLDQAGLVVLQSGGLFHTLLAPRGVAVAFERFRHGRARQNGAESHVLKWRGGPRSHRLVTLLLGADTRLSRFAADRHLLIPGLSYWALCRRPS
jgi:trans-aconitate methyltransferase